MENEDQRKEKKNRWSHSARFPLRVRLRDRYPDDRKHPSHRWHQHHDLPEVLLHDSEAHPKAVRGSERSVKRIERQ